MNYQTLTLSGRMLASYPLTSILTSIMEWYLNPPFVPLLGMTQGGLWFLTMFLIARFSTTITWFSFTILRDNLYRLTDKLAIKVDESRFLPYKTERNSY